MDIAMVPELPKSLEWLNAPATSLHEQRGRVVVLVFVNAASAWCWQRLRDAAQLQTRYPGRLQPLAVHVPRFESERDPQHVLKQLRRQGVAFPVAQDRDWHAWQHFDVQAWPTVLLIDAEGRERGRITGLDSMAELERPLAALCDALPLPNDDDAQPTGESNPEPRLPLLFPSGLAATADRLYVADSGHHRILECTHAGRVLRQFGMGTADFVDGDLEQSAFRRPHGLSVVRDVLYVADSGNHALRRIMLRSGRVDTICGNGRAGEPVAGIVANARDTALNQPQAVVATDSEVHLALAGDNRIWTYGLGRGELSCRAGSGQLEVRDGSGVMAAFAQPVALAAVQQMLYVCDALGSAIRSVQLRNGTVQTLVGQGPWEFGDADGPRQQARLQNPQAIALSPDAPLLWIADTGNGSLRTLRLGGGELSTVALPRRLQGVSGLSIAGGALWIAETDAHAVLRYDLASAELARVAIDE
ncbi:MAG: redoxin domain-containing protein [Lysobacteraceae bacterium]|nr:MAG: redoxin domain-containing protein [Xanthomonadaceae bacterium]